VIDEQGNETILAETTTSERGSIGADFNLKPGEVLFQRRTGEDSKVRTSTSATTVIYKRVKDDK